MVEKENCLLRAISPFPTVCSKDFLCRQVKIRACLEKGLQTFYHTSFNDPEEGALSTYSHTLTSFDASGKQAF